jgi:hypothetical protein
MEIFRFALNFFWIIMKSMEIFQEDIMGFPLFQYLES